jgi:hypothetical protein
MQGGCVVRLTSDERALLAQLPRELEEVLSAVGSIGDVDLGQEGGGGNAGEADPLVTAEETESQTFPPVDGVPVIPPALKRLFPPAYIGDDDAERSFVAVARADLLAHHRRALHVLSETASANALDEEQLQGWLTAINDVRLVLGTVLDIGEEAGEPEASTSPELPELIAYHYLSGLQSEMVQFLAKSLPDPVPGADDQLPEDPWGEPLGGLRWDGTQQPGAGP